MINNFAGSCAYLQLGQYEDSVKAAAATVADIESAIDRDGFKRYFRYVVRDEARSAQIDAWLDDLWPPPRNTRRVRS